MMKICFLNAWGNGSTGRLVEQLAKKCKANGDDYISFYGRGNSYLQDAICYTTKASFYCDALFSRLFDNQGLNSKNQTKKILKRIDEFKPDIIHIHNLHGYWINYELLFEHIKGKGIKVVWTLHDSWPMTGHCACYSYLNCDKFNNGCGACPGRKAYPRALADKSQKNVKHKAEVFSSIDRMIFVTPSEWMKQNVEGSMLSRYPVKVIHNQIDNQVFRYQKDESIKERLGIPKDKKIVLYVAANTTDPWKGFSILKETVEMLPDDYHVVVVGQCNIRSAGKITNLGRINDPNELAKIYSMSDVLANPSLDDNYPTVNLEALACGVPVAAFETGGIPEQIDEMCGILSKEKTKDDLVKSIIYLSGLDRDTIRRKCLEKYKNLSSSINILQEYYFLYESILSEK